MYFFSALDRSNLGNAKTDGFEQNIGLCVCRLESLDKRHGSHCLDRVGNQYNAILSTQSACFTFFTLIGAFCMRRFGPRRAMPPMMLGWGAMAMCAAAAKSFGSALTGRSNSLAPSRRRLDTLLQYASSWAPLRVSLGLRCSFVGLYCFFDAASLTYLACRHGGILPTRGNGQARGHM